MKTIGIGLIGWGFMGRTHTHALRSIALFYPDIDFRVRLVHVCSRRLEKAKEAAELVGFEKYTDDYRDVLADPEVDVVSICTPNDQHEEMAIAALKAGKHVYIDKPLAVTYESAAQIAEAFGMKVCYFSTSGTGHCHDYPCLPLEQLLAESDIVSIHAPLNERTNRLIGTKELAMMKPTAYLINMGRGAIVVEEELAEAVDKGVIAGAGMDVFVTEPIPEDHPYLMMQHQERMHLAPHVAWASIEARQRLIAIMADNIRKGW